MSKPYPIIVLTAVSCLIGSADSYADISLGNSFFGQIDEITTWPSKGLVATAEHSMRVGIWNSNTGQRIHTLKEAQDRIGAPVMLRFIPTKNALILMSNNDHVWIWNVDTGKLVLHRDPSDPVNHIIDGKLALPDWRTVWHGDISADATSIVVYSSKVTRDSSAKMVAFHDLHELNSAFNVIASYPGDSFAGDVVRFAPDCQSALKSFQVTASKSFHIEC